MSYIVSISFFSRKKRIIESRACAGAPKTYG